MSNIDLIDLYFQNKLGPEESDRFKELLHEDSQFQKDFQEISDVVGGIELLEEMSFQEKIGEVEESFQQEGFFSDENEKDIISAIQNESMKDIIKEVAKDYDLHQQKGESKVIPRSKPGNLTIRWSIAASVLLLIFAGWYFLNDQTSTERYLASYFEPATNALSTQVESELDELGFGGQNPALLRKIQSMMEAYTSADNDLFIKIYNENSRDFKNSVFSNEIEFYRSQILISEDQIEEAELLLEQLNARNLIGYQDKIQWNLSLIYLETGQVDQAKEFLLLIPQESEFYARARILLNQLHSSQ